jgi:hypothetical protein
MYSSLHERTNTLAYISQGVNDEERKKVFQHFFKDHEIMFENILVSILQTFVISYAARKKLERLCLASFSWPG